MRVIVVASRKGGSGKTTLAGHLAVQAERAGAGPVMLLDCDPQGSLSAWWNARAAAAPQFLQTSFDDLPESLTRLRQEGIRQLIIDTPPSLSPAVGQVVELSDLVLIPTRPSPHDLRAVGATVALVEHLGKPLVFVVNGAPPRARITADAIAVLSRYGPLAPSIVHQRVDFASSMIDGRTVMELPGQSRSGAEISDLWAYLEGRLSAATRPAAMPILPAMAAGDGLIPALGTYGA